MLWPSSGRSNVSLLGRLLVFDLLGFATADTEGEEEVLRKRKCELFGIMLLYGCDTCYSHDKKLLLLNSLCFRTDNIKESFFFFSFAIIPNRNASGNAIFSVICALVKADRSPCIFRQKNAYKLFPTGTEPLALLSLLFIYLFVYFFHYT